ncbi:MAG TPA: NAD+ synthase [Candidatus Solibacter sp.]|jgi:NAD+ synthase|nr:NAD+ synthase [Candidatus Solibacter sp.]
MSVPTLPTESRAEPLDSAELEINAPLVRSILVGFLRKEVRRVGYEKVVIGVSGGVDSSLVAALAAEALGPENVLGISMPYRLSNPASLADAQAVAALFGFDLRVVEITPQIDAYFDRFPEAGDARRGNKMARERMTVLYDVSFAENALVVGTSNKTELLLGYGTIFGDQASALNPIGDLYKSQVWQLAAQVGVPEQVVTKSPSADLWEGQSDEQELGFTYAAVDRLLFNLVDRRYAADDLVEMGHEPAFVEAVTRRVRMNQYKRRPPIIAKLSARTIDREFRYPRDWGV